MIGLLLAILAAAPTYIPIAAARAQTQGTTVTVLGRVTVPSGRFSSSSEDEGFAVQDQTGGIWVSVKTNLHLHDGERVLVSGTVGTGAGKLQIASDAEHVQRTKRALRVATGQVGSATAGDIITVEGTITQAPEKDAQYGWKMLLDDGSGAVLVYLNASTDIRPHAAYLKKGRRLGVTGFGNQYDTHYEVDPRGRRDLHPLP